ncbi:MAG: hypothetical protein H6727_19045 [Myxococcales bacterium]|nr:hypothetical protein [Myxococcales bacterium]
MDSYDWKPLLQKMEEVGKLDPQAHIRHVYCLEKDGLKVEQDYKPYTPQPTISSEKLEELEARYGIRFPWMFRSFLLEVGDGFFSVGIKPVEYLLAEYVPGDLQETCVLIEEAVNDFGRTREDGRSFLRLEGAALMLFEEWSGGCFSSLSLVMNGEHEGKLFSMHDEEGGEFLAEDLATWLHELLDRRLKAFRRQKEEKEKREEERKSRWKEQPDDAKTLLEQIRAWAFEQPKDAEDVLIRAFAKQDIPLNEWNSLLDLFFTRHAWAWGVRIVDGIWSRLIEEAAGLLPYQRVPLWEKAGLCLLEMDDERCVFCFEQLLEEKPFHYSNLARFYMHRGELEKALSFAQQAPEQFYTMGIKAQILESLQRFDEAEEVFRKGIATYQQDPVCHLGLARVLFMKKSYEECLQELDFVINRSMYGQQKAWEQRSLVMSAMGRRDEAFGCLQRMKEQKMGLGHLREKAEWSWVKQEEWDALEALG